MAEFTYANGRVLDSLQFISKEIKEFDNEYAGKSWQVYQGDPKLQKLMERTVENILTALIEICGTLLAEKGIAVENYSKVLAKACEILGFSKNDQENLAKLAVQRNRLAHRYLDFKWQAIKSYGEQKNLIQKLLQVVMEQEKRKQQ